MSGGAWVCTIIIGTKVGPRCKSVFEGPFLPVRPRPTQAQGSVCDERLSTMPIMCITTLSFALINSWRFITTDKYRRLSDKANWQPGAKLSKFGGFQCILCTYSRKRNIIIFLIVKERECMFGLFVILFFNGFCMQTNVVFSFKSLNKKH